MAGIDFFPTGKETKIKVTNLEVILLNKPFFEYLLGETLTAIPTAQFYFERVFEEKQPTGEALNGAHYYSFTVGHAIEVLRQSNKDTSLWETLDPKTDVTLIKEACVIQE